MNFWSKNASTIEVHNRIALMALGDYSADVFFADVFWGGVADEFVAADEVVRVDGAVLSF